jgi:hypothetical protein
MAPVVVSVVGILGSQDQVPWGAKRITHPNGYVAIVASNFVSGDGQGLFRLFLIAGNGWPRHEIERLGWEIWGEECMERPSSPGFGSGQTQTYRFQFGVDLTAFNFDLGSLPDPEWIILRLIYAEVCHRDGNSLPSTMLGIGQCKYPVVLGCR